ncbi:DUF6318 family protein [Cellulomonas sp. McL0617]|uniref:DUF6318 family protein n=1 Tax=Cellulomonas sp. McL0617 TaxID=3415675 RepID=UPI003CE6A3E4
MEAPPSAAGATSVAKYFLQLLPYVNATGDLSDWTALSHVDCLFCASVTKDVQAQTADGTHDEGGAIAIADLGATEVTPSAYYQVDASLMQAASQTIDGSGAVVESFPPTAAQVSVAVVWDGRAYSIRGVQTHPVGQ